MKPLIRKFVVNKGMSALMELIPTNAWANIRSRYFLIRMLGSYRTFYANYTLVELMATTYKYRQRNIVKVNVHQLFSTHLSTSLWIPYQIWSSYPLTQMKRRSCRKAKQCPSSPKHNWTPSTNGLGPITHQDLKPSIGSPRPTTWTSTCSQPQRFIC